MHEHTKHFMSRYRAELEGNGFSLRKVDEGLKEGLKEGVRHKFYEGRDCPYTFDDYYSGTDAAQLDPHRLMARIAGYGHPFDIAALRGKRVATWPAAKAEILKALDGLKGAGSQGFEETRPELRRLEYLYDDEPAAAEADTWRWLERERRPGAVVGLLAALAVDAHRAKAHNLLKIACEILDGQLESAAGGKLACVAGQCFVKVGFPREGLHILRCHALGIVDIYGDNDDHAAVHFHISRAAGRIGEDELSRRSLKKAVALGGDRLRFYALQSLAFKELSTGDVETAVTLYDELVRLTYFAKVTRQLKAAIYHSRLAAKFVAGHLDAEAAPEFEAAVAGIREVMPVRDQVSAVMDFALFLWQVGKHAEAGSNLEAELWNVLDLDDAEITRKFAGLWETFKLPRDTRFSTMAGRLGAHLAVE